MSLVVRLAAELSGMDYGPSGTKAAATPVPKTAHAPGDIPPITKTQAAVLVIPSSPAVASASGPTAVGSRTTSKTSRGAWSLDGGAGPVGLRPPASLTFSAMSHAAAMWPDTTEGATAGHKRRATDLVDDDDVLCLCHHPAERQRHKMT